MIIEKKKKKNGFQFFEDMKEKSIRTHYYSEEKRIHKKPLASQDDQNYPMKPFLFFDPPEVVLQNIELKKVYEVPVRVHNISTTSKRIMVKQPSNPCFKIVSDKKQKNFQISPGLYYEFLVVFEPLENKNYSDVIEVNSENNLKILLRLNANKCRPIIIFDPFINLGFVPINTKKVEKLTFVNEGSESCNIELKIIEKNSVELELAKDKFTLSKLIKDRNNPNYGKNYFESFIIYSPETPNTVNCKVEVLNLNDNSILGIIEIIGTSVEQQLSVVFEDGGGPATEVNFGQLYYGQKKSCPAFLVNNGPYEISFRMFFHVDKDRFDNNLKLDDSDFACTPEQAGIEMTQRILGCNPKSGVIKPYEQLPINFQAKSKLKENFKKWGGHITEEYEKFVNKEGSVARLEENKIEIHKSLVAIKFDQNFEKKDNLELNVYNEDKICKTISVYMELKTVYPEVLFDKTLINFWDCKIGDSKSAKLRVTNKNDFLSVDFEFGKIPYFFVEPSTGSISPNSEMNFIVTFLPKNYGKFTNTLPFKFVNGLYEIGIKLFAKATLEVDSEKEKKMNEIRDNNYNTVNNTFNNTISNANNTINSGNVLLHAKTNYNIGVNNTEVNYNFSNKILSTLPNSNLQDTKKKTKKVFGPEATDIDFMKKPKLISDDLAMNYTLPNLKNHMTLPERTMQMYSSRILQLEKDKSNKVIVDNFKKKFEEYKKEQDHRTQANNTLVEFRKHREEQNYLQNKSKEGDIILKTENINSSISNQTTGNFYTTANGKINLDSLNYISNRLESPKFDIPKTHEGLWVNRPIGKYEPSDLVEQLTIKPDFNPLVKPEKMPELYPKSAIDKRDCEMQLDGHKLQRIYVGSREINFGEIYKGSEESRTLWVKNSLRTSIFFEIMANDYPELKSIVPSSFVIGPGCSEGCIITFCSHLTKKHNFYIKYKINYKQQFKVKVLADVVFANLKYTPLQKFAFQQMNSTEMTVSQKLPLYNGGNAPAIFTFESGKSGHFTVKPDKGTVKPKEELVVTVEFDPLEVEHKREIVDELRCIIDNGEKIPFPVFGQIVPSKAEFVTSDTVNFGDISVSVYERASFSIKCDKGGPTAFMITDYPSNLSFSETRGIIDNKIKNIEIKIICETVALFKTTVKIKIRGGGSPLNLYIIANPIEPTVAVHTNLIDFGEQSFGEQEIRPLILSNKSNLSGYVVVDLRSPDFDFFKLRLAEKYKGSKDYLLKDLDREGEEEEEDSEQMGNISMEQNIDEELLGLNVEKTSSNDEGLAIKNTNKKDIERVVVEENKFANMRFFQVEVKKWESLEFDFIFSPGNDSINKSHQFTLNLTMKGSTSVNPALQVDVIAKQKDSLITLNPREKLLFKKTFIGKSDKSLATSWASLKLYCNHIGKQKFTIDTSQMDKCFTIEEVFEEKDRLAGRKKTFNEQTMEGNFSEESLEIVFKCSFTPREAKKYESKIIFKPFNHDIGEYEKGKEILFIGEGALPKINFDKREIILPVVPLGFESRGIVRIRNEGYGDMALSHKIVSEMGNIDIKVNWPGGNKIGILKMELKLEVVYKAPQNKPLSFSCKLLITDQDGESFFIFVYGTSDNSIFSNYNYYYLQSESLEIKVVDENINLHIKNNDNNGIVDDHEFYDNSKKKEVKIEKKSSALNFGSTNFNDKSFLTLTYTKDYKAYLLKTCKYILSFLNNVLSTAITSFPESLSMPLNKGESLMNLIENLSSGKPLEFKIDKLEEEPNKRVKTLREHFYKIIYYLQEQGANLNTVLPEYLLDHASFKRYLKIDDKYTSKVLSNTWEKTTKVLFYYKFIHLESWITLVYQIIKIYYLSRVNVASVLKSIRHLNEDYKKLVTPMIKNSHSNFYSSSELLLFKWLKINHEYTANQSLKQPLSNFSSNLSDGSVILSTISSYLPHIDEQLRIPTRKKNNNALDREPRTNTAPEKIFNILKEYGVFTHFTVEDLTNPSDREMLIFVITLFQNLPHFIPNTIYFTCILNEVISQNITISNQVGSKKKIDYSIKKFGSNDFVVNKEITDIRIAPGDPPFVYKITYKSRFKSEVKGKIFFINKSVGMMYQAVPIVYDLVSRVTERKSLGNIIYFRSPLYKKTEHKIWIKCPFSYKGDFKIFPPEIKRKTVKQPKKRNNAYYSRKKDENTVDDFVPPVFLLKSNDMNLSYRLDPEVPRDIPIFFCPIDTDTYQANLVFYNETLGEFQITIEASPEPPEIFETLNFEAEVNEPKDLNLEIKHQNKYLSQACSMIYASETNKEKQAFLKKMLDIKQDTKTVYSVDLTKQNFTSHNNFTMDAVYNTDKPYDQIFQLMNVKFISKSVQTVEGELIMRSQERQNDVRIYKLIVKVKPKNIYGKLVFNCPVGQEIVQKIPFFNSNDQDCIIKSELTQTPNKGYFGCYSEKRINKGVMDHFTLRFSPTEKINITGVLVLKNSLTGEIYEYKLEGTVDDPLAEDMIYIVCPVRKTEIRKIIFENSEERDIVYTVETDLSEVISGPEKFTVKPKQKFEYEFTVKPLLGKTYFGKLTFYPDILKTYKWYTVKIDSKSQVEPEEIKLRTPIRKTVYVEIVLDNPTNEYITYDIEYEGDYLKGENFINVEPKKSKVYKLYYSPIKVGKNDGLLHIYNERVGERIIKLNLICEEPKPIYVDTMYAELGKYADHSLILENPLDEEVQVYVTQSNKSQFQIIPEKIILPDNSAREIIVRYTPSTLEHPEDCRILFDTLNIGKWEFFFKGKGNYPSTMPKTTISTYVGGSVSGNILFKNPFNDKISVTIDMKNDQQGTFKLMLTNRKLIVDNFKMLQIPVGFFPKKLMKYNTEVVITATSLLKWVFPIEGITEVKSKGLDFFFKTKAKQVLDTKVILDLSAVPEQIDIHELSIEIKCKEEKYKNLIDKALNLALEYPFIRTERENQNKVPLNIKFYPLRPFKTECEVCLVKRSGGQWIYTMIFESLEGEPEDIIKVQSSIGKESSVSFKLYNWFTKNSKFIAYFTHDSSPEFGVKPKEGVLDQSNRDGNLFMISYKPIEYGKVKIGKLIIESDEIQWIFHVHGSHLDYVLPDVKSNFMAKTQSSLCKTEYSSNLKTTVTKFMKTKGNDSRSKSPKWR